MQMNPFLLERYTHTYIAGQLDTLCTDYGRLWNLDLGSQCPLTKSWVPEVAAFEILFQ